MTLVEAGRVTSSGGRTLVTFLPARALAIPELIDFPQSVALTDFRPARFEEAP